VKEEAMILVDSSVWIDYFNGVDNTATNFLHVSLGQSEIAVGDLILAEVLQGFRREADFKAARDALLLFPIVNIVEQTTAIRSAEHYRLLR
jgi:predicted nucleic acid-binding protein